MAKRIQKKRRPSRQRRAGRTLYRTAVALSALIVAGFVAWQVLVRPPAQSAAPPSTAPLPTAVQPAGESAAPQEPAEETAPPPERRAYTYTFLLAASDQSSGNADTIMVATYDVPNAKVGVVSIPRDTLVDRKTPKINAAYLGKDGASTLKSVVADLVGFPIDYYITVDITAFKALVNAVDGVDFYIPCDMDYDDPTQDLHIHVDKGEQKLDGDKAMQLLRWRKNNKLVNGHVVNYDAEGGDVRRIQIQQDFLKATLQQCLEKVRDLPTILRLGRIFLENVETDLPLNSVAYLAQSAVLGGLSMEDVTFHTMPYQGGMVWSRSLRGMQDYVTPRADELLKLVNQYLNPYNADLTRDSLDVMSIQADGTIASSTGRLADTKHNVLWLEYQAAQNAPPEETEPPAPEETPPEESGGPETPEETALPETPLPGDTSPTVTLPVEPAPTEAPAVQTLPVESRPLPDGIPIA